MNNKLFERLYESMTQMNEIVNGERVPSREFVVDAIHVKEIRKKTGLTQEKFCHLMTPGRDPGKKGHVQF